MKSKYYYWLLCGLMIVIALSCSQMNDLHDQYLQNGEIIYTGKVDSAKVFAGKNRLMLRCYVTDPKAKNLLVYWNLRAESQSFSIPVHNAEDPVDIALELEEGSYYFELLTMNENMQNKSVPFNVEGTVYGTLFQSSLLNRNIANMLRPENQVVIIHWGSADARSIGSELIYKNQEGEDVILTISIDDNVTEITDLFDDAEDIKLKSMFLPEPNALDIFYVEFTTVNIPEPARLSMTPTDDVVVSGDGTSVLSGSFVYAVTTNVPTWSVDFDQPWLTAVKTETGFTLMVTHNNLAVSRTATMTVTAGAAYPYTLKVEQLPGFEDITAQVLKNTTAPFVVGEMIFNNRLYLAQDWIANTAAAGNGSIDNSNARRLGLWSAATFPVASFTNGKLYQTVELEAGTYRFDVAVYRSGNATDPPKAYIVAAIGNDLPDTNNVEQEALKFVSLPNVTVNADILYVTEFTLSVKSTVSLGFVVTTAASGTTQIIISRVALLKKY